MKVSTGSFAVRLQQGFEVYVLNNDEVELAVVPELGARIISLRNLRTGREWMWHPSGGLKLFRNRPGDDFAQSPLVGTDECLPTIAACSLLGRELPDHGEVWSMAWKVDAEAWKSGVLKTSVKMKISPFEFQRTIELSENDVCISYKLTNCNAQDERFLWAIHPLLKLLPGDQLEMPASTRALLPGAAWIDAVDSATPNGNCAKVIASPVREGLIAIGNQVTGDRLEFLWNPKENGALGLWLTRGGWHGHHHFALEPTNADADSLALAAERN
ncbi:MAG TPA: hypothetical protein VFC07_07315, partial [Verrucomicrobiae bacterium]|nr:hypothetical protein [Verrucomicrobiae bacterium]